MVKFMMGCKYRQRTGACCCENPPIGCSEDPPDRRPREPAGPPPPPPPPPPLAKEFPIMGSNIKVPAMGWRCSSDKDVFSAISAGVSFVDACGSVSIESAIGTATASSSTGIVLLATRVAYTASVADDVEAAALRLGRPSKELLVYVVATEGGSVDDLAAEWVAVSETVSLQVGALGVSCTSAEMASALLRKLQADRSPMPGVLLLPTNPTTPHRALLGLCRRLSVLPVAFSPLPPASAGPADPARMLAWSVARGVPALCSTADGEGLLPVAASTHAPLDAEERAAINALEVHS